MIATASASIVQACAPQAAVLLLVDDHPVFHTGLHAMLASLRPMWRLVGVYDAVAGVATAASEGEIDLVLIDLALQSGDGFEALSTFGAALPATPRVVISGREDVAARVRARQLGASGFIAKAWRGERIALALDRVLAGETSFDEPAAAGCGPRLSARQLQVLSLLAEGLPNKTIEAQLGIAERTVRAHLTELFHALGARNRTQALLQAQKLGLIP